MECKEDGRGIDQDNLQYQANTKEQNQRVLDQLLVALGREFELACARGFQAQRGPIACFWSSELAHGVQSGVSGECRDDDLVVCLP